MSEAAASELASIEPAWVIEHLGSTSVPGLIAKPIIDLAVRLASPSDLDRHRPDLEARGWRLNPGGPASRTTFERSDDAGRRTHLAHFFRPELWHDANQRIFRDWLRDHDDDRDLYARAKEAASAATDSGLEYTRLKTAAVQQIMDRARAARGLLRVDVWEK